MEAPVRTLDATQLDQQLILLRSLLLGLPPSIPEGTQFYNFKYFSVIPDEVDFYGEAGAVNHSLELIFCPGKRVTEPIQFHERGSGLVAVTETLRAYTAKFPEDNVLQKWILDLITAAEHAGAVSSSTCSKTIGELTMQQ